MSNQFKVTADGFAMVMNSAQKMTAGSASTPAQSVAMNQSLDAK